MVGDAVTGLTLGDAVTGLGVDGDAVGEDVGEADGDAVGDSVVGAADGAPVVGGGVGGGGPNCICPDVVVCGFRAFRASRRERVRVAVLELCSCGRERRCLCVPIALRQLGPQGRLILSVESCQAC